LRNWVEVKRKEERDNAKTLSTQRFAERSDGAIGIGVGYTGGMGTIDEVLAANEVYSRTHELRRLTPRPARKLAVLMCMDTRLSIRMMGLVEGDAHIIRNAGGIVTDDALRSLIISHYLLGTEEFMVINHTDCGLMQTSEQDLRTRIQNRAGTAAVAPAFFYAFQNIEENVRHQLQKLRSHPWVPEKVAVRGFVYDVSTGRLREVTDFRAGSLRSAAGGGKDGLRE
jgi:carbonic anhydrase